MALTPTSSVAVPVSVNVRLEMTLPDGPVIEVVGVWSLRPKVSNFLLAFDASVLPLTATVRAQAWMRWLPGMVSASRHVVARAFGAARVASIVLAAPQVVRLSCR